MKHFSKNQGYGRVLSRYIDFLSRRTGWVLLFYVLIMGFIVYQARFIRLDSNLYSLFPQKMTSLQNLQKMESYYGGAGMLTLSVAIPHPDQMLSVILPRYIDDNQGYIRDMERIQDKTVADTLNPENIENVVGSVKDYRSKMQHYYLPILEEEAKKQDGVKRKYTELFWKEYQQIITPDVDSKFDAFKKTPTKNNLAALIGSFQDNISGANLYIHKIEQTLPLNREKLLEHFAKTFANRLSADPSIIFVDYAFNQKFVQDHLLYFLDLSDITYIQNQLQNRIDYERRKSLLSSFLMVDQNDSDLQFQFLRNKYIRSRGEGVSRKFIRLQNPNAVFDGTNKGNKEQYYLSVAKDMVVLNVRGSRGAIDINYALFFLNRVKELFAKVQKTDPQFQNLQLIPSGQYVDREEDARVLRQDFAHVTPFSMIFVVIVIVAYFRSFVAVVVVCLPLFSDMMSALGFVRLTYGHLNLVSSFLVAIISGLGMNIGTHLLSRYVEAKGRGKTPKEALFEVFTTIFFSNITATLTTAAGFFILALSSFQGFREFGMIAGVGMLSLLGGIVLVFPTIILWFENRGWFRIKGRGERKLDSLRGHPFPLFKTVSFLGLGMLVFSLFSIQNIHFNANFTTLIRKSDAVPTIKDYYDKASQQILKLSSSSGIIPIYAPNFKIYQQLSQHFLNDRFSNENFRVETLLLYMPEDQIPKQREIHSLQKTLQSGLLNANDDTEVQKRIDFLKRITKTPPVSGLASVPSSLKDLFLGIQPGYFLLYYAMEMPKSVEIIEHYYNDFENIQEEFGDQGVFLASDIWIFGDLLHVLEKESIVLLLGILVTFIFLLWLDFRSLVLVAAALIPLFVGFLWMVGFCNIFSIEWNFFNVLMFPVVAGLGIDYGVHMLHRIREEGSKNLAFVFGTTGKTMWVAACEDMIGFGVLIIALYYGLVTTGQILIIGVSSCLLSGSLFLPAMIQWYDDIKTRGWKKSVFAIRGWVPERFLRSSKKEANPPKDAQ